MKTRYMMAGLSAATAFVLLQPANGEDVSVSLDSSDGSSAFLVENNSSEQCLKVISNGRVSIGNVDPTNPLYVYGAGLEPGGVPGWSEVMARFRDWGGHSAISVDALSGMDPILYLAEDGEAVWALRSDASEGNELEIRYLGDGGPGTVFTIETNTYVGIGSAVNPQAPLHVWSQGNWNLDLTDGDFKVGTEIYGLQVGVATGGGGSGDVRMRAQGGTDRLILGGGSNDVLIVRETGVGIGTFTPDVDLHVVESAYEFAVTVENDWNAGYGRSAVSEVSLCGTHDLDEGGAWSIGIHSEADIAANFVGTILQRGSTLHADYVFEPDYQLESIEEHAAFMWENKHLKAIPPKKVDARGLEVIEMGGHRRGLVEELEKAHIYIESLNEENKSLRKRMEALEARMERIGL